MTNRHTNKLKVLFYALQKMTYKHTINNEYGFQNYFYLY